MWLARRMLPKLGFETLHVGGGRPNTQSQQAAVVRVQSHPRISLVERSTLETGAVKMIVDCWMGSGSNHGPTHGYKHPKITVIASRGIVAGAVSPVSESGLESRQAYAAAVPDAKPHVRLPFSLESCPLPCRNCGTAWVRPDGCHHRGADEHRAQALTRHCCNI